LSTLTTIDRKTLAHALMCARNAKDDLGSNSWESIKHSPAIHSLNRTMERLASIETLLEQVLA
jgi:hypothetical protein